MQYAKTNPGGDKEQRRTHIVLKLRVTVLQFVI